LSIPSTMTLAGTVALKLMDTNNDLIFLGLAAAIGVGVAVGVANYGLIKLLRIPPIIATLSSSFIVQSTAIWYNRGLRVQPPTVLAEFATSSTLGIPNVTLVALVISVAAWVLLERGLYGRWVSAIGQNMRAARLAGVPVDGVRFVTYVQVAVLAA